MKTMIATITLLLALTSTANARSLSDYHLDDLMGRLSDIASGGASLLYFGYSENFFQKDLSRCQVISGEEAADKSLEIFMDVINGGESGPDDADHLLDKEEDIRELLGMDSYYHCVDFRSEYRAFLKVDRFIRTDFRYRLELTTGYED
ncbi:MAG: hypothetical protein AAF203_05190 [Pseudomonadota bacterium]